jgi:hypothetical protein
MIARILMLRGDDEAVHKIMTRIYAYATPEQVDLKVRGRSKLIYIYVT